jgi:hypothetical protein
LEVSAFDAVLPGLRDAVGLLGVVLGAAGTVGCRGAAVEAWALLHRAELGLSAVRFGNE